MQETPKESATATDGAATIPAAITPANSAVEPSNQERSRRGRRVNFGVAAALRTGLDVWRIVIFCIRSPVTLKTLLPLQGQVPVN